MALRSFTTLDGQADIDVFLCLMSCIENLFVVMYTLITHNLKTDERGMSNTHCLWCLGTYTTKSPPDVCQYLVDDHGFAIYERNSKPTMTF